MKSTLKITTLGTTLGVVETRESTYTTSGIMELSNALFDTLKEFSANRGKKKITVTLSIEKGTP